MAAWPSEGAKFCGLRVYDSCSKRREIVCEDSNEGTNDPKEPHRSRVKDFSEINIYNNSIQHPLIRFLLPTTPPLLRFSSSQHGSVSATRL